LLRVKFKALLMEEKDVDLWWDVVQDIVQKDIGKVCIKYERNERLYRHKIFQMEKIMPLFEYEPLVLFPEPETLNEEEDKRDIDGARPSCTRVAKKPRDLRRGKDSPEKEATKCTLKQVKYVLEEVSYKEYAFTTTKIGEQIQLEEHDLRIS